MGNSLVTRSGFVIIIGDISP